MKDMKTADTQQNETSAAEDKMKPYQAPELIEHGDVQSIILGGFSGNQDGAIGGTESA